MSVQEVKKWPNCLRCGIFLEGPNVIYSGIVVRLHLVDLLQEDIHCPKMLRILPGKSVRSLMLLISQSFNLSFSTMTLVLDRGYANFCPLLDPAKTLSEEGFERVNRVKTPIYFNCLSCRSHFQLKFQLIFSQPVK